MSYIAFLFLLWGLLIFIGRFFLNIYTLLIFRKIDNEFGVDKWLFLIPELTPLMVIKKQIHTNKWLKKLYILYRLYKYFFWIGLILLLGYFVFMDMLKGKWCY